MRKILSLCISVCFILSLSHFLVACNNHTAKASWSYDNKFHWHNCECSNNCKEHFNVEQHTLIDTTDKDTESTETERGKDYSQCSTCGYETFTYKNLHYHSYPNGICSCGKKENSYVSEEDWNNVFTGDYLNNVTIEYTLHFYKNSNPHTAFETETLEYSLYSEDAQYTRIDSESIYHIKKNNCWYAVMLVDLEWYGIHRTASEAHKFRFQNTDGCYFKNRYNNFSYNSENKYFYAYNITLENNDELCEYIKVEIKNNKLTRIEKKVNYNSTEHVIHVIEFSNYGTTIVDVPEFIIIG
ncbi:MAG: hypothetical protein E7361_03300 [Clostridiales bacterium]|nr:hypothetical protein [Clostridiales bacterium]